MIVIIMTALTLSIISLNISQVNVAEQEVRRIQSEPIAGGWLARMFSMQQSNISGLTLSMSNSETLGTTDFQSNIEATPVTDPALSPTISYTMNSTVTY